MRLLFALLAVRAAVHSAEPAISPWRTIAHMPADNHDLAAAVVGGKLYVAGGATNDYKGTGQVHCFDEIWELTPRSASSPSWLWRAVAKFSRPRIYCGTAAFEGRVWVAGGDILHEDGQRRPTTLVEIYDPKTGTLTRAPNLPVALPRPLALAAAGRLWLVGTRDRVERGQFASIGPGETAWRIEPDALPKMWALAGTALTDKLYLCVPDTGLAEFDPATRAWRVIPGPTQSRSGQVAAWRGEIWVMGGVDISDRTATHIYNPMQCTWRRGPALPTPLSWGAAEVLDDQLIVTGGAWLDGPPENRKYKFIDRTIALRADAIPPAPTVAATGAALPRWSDQKLRGTSGPGLPFTSEREFTAQQFSRLTTIVPVPGTRRDAPERLLVSELDGAVWTFLNQSGSPPADRVLDMTALSGRETHTASVAFHPRYPAVPQIFVFSNRRQPKPAENTLARYTVTRLDPPFADPASEQVLLRWPSDGHNGGEIAFGPDGFLYLSAGDRSSPGDPRDLGQRTDLISGGVLRIDIDRADAGKNYAVPPDNPFVGQTGVLPEIWAYGLRNPWRLTFGSGGDLWTADNGDDSWESVHLVRRGANYGWSVFEGTHLFKRQHKLAGPAPRLTPPVVELPHSEARSVVGGLVYRGEKFPALHGHYLFGDYVTGSIWAFQRDGAAAKNYRKIADTRVAILAFGTDRAGEIYFSGNDGRNHRLVAAPATDASPTREFPRRLSETGLFAAISSRTAAPGVISYEINAGLWSDGARAHRLLAVSAWQTVTIDTANDHRWVLPDGSAVARTLEINATPGPCRVETQVMFREQGAWRFYTYAWNEAQTDAELVPEAGETRPVPGIANRTWRYAARSECTICHTSATHHTLGLSTAQLNRDADLSLLGRRVENQIAALSDAGLLKSASVESLAQIPRRIAPHDPTQSLEARARSYLDINCAHCHRPGGVGGRPSFSMAESVPLAKTGLLNGTPLVPLLGSGARVIVPGAPERSELFHRLTLKEGGRMPLLGSEQTDAEGVELIRQWIAQLRRVP